jgi:Zn-dependent M28 family amino/carboxypeptidase
MRQKITLFLALFFAPAAWSQNLVPVISNVQVTVNWLTKTMAVQYDLSDAENDMMSVKVELSDNGGASYDLTSQSVFSGDIGAAITSGSGKTVNIDLAGVTPQPGAAYRVRIVAEDGQPFDLQALVDAVDSTRLRSDLEFVQGIRHRTAGVAHLNTVRDSIQHCFENAGLATKLQSWTYVGYNAQNVIGSNSGVESPDNVVIVDAHYDSVANAPGADDNGSGTVGVMEIARLLSPFPSKKTMRFIGFDLEEPGLLGSIKYVQSGIPTGENIDAVINFEMIGYYSEEPNSQTLPAGFNLLFPDAYNAVVANQYRGDFITNVGNVFSSSLVNLFAASAATYVPELKVTSLQVPGNGELVPDLRRSDHAPFWSAGYKALMLTDGANFRNECYHTPQDTLGNKLSFTFMSQVVKTSLATVAALVEPLHGSMYVAEVDTPSGASELADCKPSCYISGNNLVFSNEKCDWVNSKFSLVDMTGKLVWEHVEKGGGDAVYQFVLPVLPAGPYVLNVNTETGIWSQKVLVKH